MTEITVVPFAGRSVTLPSLALGSITAFAQSKGLGAPGTRFRFTPQLTDLVDLEAELDRDSTPHVVLLSNYLWTTETNLAASAMVKERAPGSITVHGGPNTPFYPGDNLAFFERHPHVDVTVRQEGEVATWLILQALADAGRLDPEVLKACPGCSVRTSDGVHRSDAVARIDDLADLPSAYLTDQLSHLSPENWWAGILETNRGCPYGCTYCDWGQMTLSRVRKFPLERVFAEIDWMVEHRVETIFIADANFGIFRRDVDIARHIADQRAATGFPRHAIATFTKNTNRYVREILQTWTAAGVWAEGVLSVQSTDPTTLATIRRKNIRTERYEELAAEFRELDLPIASDVILGLPGSTVESFKRDLQYFFDRRVMIRIFEAILLPNSPMNDPDYRREHQIEAGEDLRVMSTATFTREDRATMMRLRHWNRVAIDLGVLRVALYVVQRDADVAAIDVLAELDRAVCEEPYRYPLAAFLGRYGDLMPVPPGSWQAFYAEFRRFLEERCALRNMPGWDTIAATEVALRPAPGRRFPEVVELDHDIAAYVADSAGTRPLTDYGPGTISITDPHGITTRFLKASVLHGGRADAGANWFWWDLSWELESVLTWPMARASPSSDGRGDAIDGGGTTSG